MEDPIITCEKKRSGQVHHFVHFLTKKTDVSEQNFSLERASN